MLGNCAGILAPKPVNWRVLQPPTLPMDTLTTLLAQYGLFFAQTATIVVAIALVIAWVAGTIQHARQAGADGLEVINLGERLEAMADTLRAPLLDKAARKARAKTTKAEAKAKTKAAKLGKHDARPRMFVVDFHGDIRASAVAHLREEITAILQVAESDDEVLIKLESAGGMVHSYGLAASQMQRLRDHGIRVTASVDKLAASGGYLMACVADRIVAAPFAIIGSIGVVGQLPNFNRLLKEHNIDFELHTAGDHKRTLTTFGENTDEGRAKFRQELEATHGMFKNFVAEHRADLAVDEVATGEHWHGSRALTLRLVDELATSDDLILSAVKEQRPVFQVKFRTRARWADRIAGGADAALGRVANRLLRGFGAG